MEWKSKEGLPMRKIDLSESPMPDISPSKVYFIIEMAHEYQSEDVGVEPDASSQAATSSGSC